MSEVRLIDGNALERRIKEEWINQAEQSPSGMWGNVPLAYADCHGEVVNAPTITPESLGWRKEVVGRWYPNMEVARGEVKHEQECSVCKQRIGGTDKPPFCPNCGARMEGGLHG